MTNLGFCKTQVLFLAVAVLSLVPAGLAQQNQQRNNQMPTGAPMAQNSFCGNNALCYDGGDFAAVVTQFRTSTDAQGNKILDAIIHFQNKTNQPVGLGYVDGSASGLDDRGNRYGLNVGWGGVRGMGVMAGNTANPSFVLNPGGSGDARFEYIWVRPPANAVIGVNYEIELDVREMNRAEGNQWVLGNDTLMHYQGLVNGISMAGSSYNSNGAGAPGSSYVQGQAPANGGTMSNGYMAPVNNAVGGVTNGVTNGYNNAVGGVTNGLSNGYNNAVGNVSNGATSGINNAVGNVTNGMGQPVNGYNAPANGGYMQQPAYGAPNTGYSQPTNGMQPANNQPVQANQMKVAAQPANMKAAVPVTQRTQPAVNKAVAIQPIPATKTKTVAPPAAPAKKPSPANPTQH